MAQPVPVELVYPDQDHSDSLGDYDHYYEFDQFDHPSAASQKPDTLGASSSGPDPSRSAKVADFDNGHQQQSQHQHQQHQQQRQQQQQQPPLPPPQPLVYPVHQSPLPPTAAGHEARQGQGLSSEPSASPSSSPSGQPYRPESVPAHARSPPLHSPRSTRSHSLAASLASLGNQSPVRRKPLSPTASPLAIRFSSKSALSSHMPSLPAYDLDQPPDSGFFSLNSPDLYDLGPKGAQDLAPGPSLLPAPLEEQSEEEYVSIITLERERQVPMLTGMFRALEHRITIGRRLQQGQPGQRTHETTFPTPTLPILKLKIRDSPGRRQIQTSPPWPLLRTTLITSTRSYPRLLLPIILILVVSCPCLVENLFLHI